MGSGNGYGGAIAMLGICSPEFDNCRFINNSAQGGQGGAGGKGGNGTYPPYYNSGLEGGGGNAGVSDGNGIGGAIYASTLCEPVFNNCLFENNVAKTGPRGNAGGRGFGNVNITTVNGVALECQAAYRVKCTPAQILLSPAAQRILGISTPQLLLTAILSTTRPMWRSLTTRIRIQVIQLAPVIYIHKVLLHTTKAPPKTSWAIPSAEPYISVMGANNKAQIPLINTCDFINNGGGTLYFGSSCTLSIGNTSAVNRGQPGSKNLFQGNNRQMISSMGFLTIMGRLISITCRPWAAAVLFM